MSAEKRNCLTCGALFTARMSPSWVALGYGRFCSRRCSDARPRPSLQDQVFAGSIPEPNSGCWLWIKARNGGVYGGGYGRLHEDLAHRMSYRAFVGEIPLGLCVLHRCDTPPCVNPSHLFLGTHADNVLDKCRKGRADAGRGDRHGTRTHPEQRRIGTRNPRSVLNEDLVRAIRAEVAGGLGPSAVARRLGLSGPAVYGVATGRNWRWVL